MSFDYNNEHFPMMKYKNVFKDPATAPNDATKRHWQLLRYSILSFVANSTIRECRGIKFSHTGQLLCRPFHKFFNLNELAGITLLSIDLELTLIRNTEIIK